MFKIQFFLNLYMKQSETFYLCYSYNTFPNYFFMCKRFNSLDLALHQQTNLTVKKISNFIIPVCKYIPWCFHIYVLRYKLQKKLYGIKIY
jgi:hypothetical protein